MRTMGRAAGLLLLIAASAWAAMPAGAAPGAASVVNGTIAAVNGGSVTVAAADGSETTAKIESDTLIISRGPASLGMIKPGDALAVTAKRQADGSLTAVSINIFSPALWDRVRKGQWIMESGNVMTNALVEQVVERVEGRILDMKLDQGTRTIGVPTGTAIHSLATVGWSALKPGMHVTVRETADSDGTTKASSIVFDRPG
jgi:hypothetical protein